MFDFSNNSGYTIIEVMVAMIILTSGLMGMAYMQNLSAQVGQDSYSRSQILFTANELIDSMRAMQISPDDGSDNHTIYTTIPSPGADCFDNISSAENYVNCFYQEVSEKLPFGTANIALDGNKYLITVYWSERGMSRDGEEILTQSQCESESEVGQNRVWSGDLSWPFGSGPDENFCAVSRSWSIEVYNASVL